jgi:hypothetical protein
MGSRVYPIVEPFEVDDGAALALLERLVRPGAVVVRHSPLLLRVGLLPTVPAAYAEPKP